MVASSYEEDIQFGKILKKYNSRKRKYKPSMIQETSSEEDEEEAACRRERIRILREAQKIKEKSNWLNWMDNKTDTSSKEAKKENSAVEGLKHNFAQEQADGQDKRMMAYIEKEVAKKYHGETEENQSQPGEVSLPPQWEQIRRLRSQLGLPLSKKTYQPETILPLGGMEEVLLDSSSTTRQQQTINNKPKKYCRFSTKHSKIYSLT